MRLSSALRKLTYQYMSLLAHIFIHASLLAIIFLCPVEHTEAYGYVSQNPGMSNLFCRYHCVLHNYLCDGNSDIPSELVIRIRSPGELIVRCILRTLLRGDLRLFRHTCHIFCYAFDHFRLLSLLTNGVLV